MGTVTTKPEINPHLHHVSGGDISVRIFYQAGNLLPKCD